eukprot:5949466-Amphidinium_carterae.1
MQSSNCCSAGAIKLVPTQYVNCVSMLRYGSTDQYSLNNLYIVTHSTSTVRHVGAGGGVCLLAQYAMEGAELDSILYCCGLTTNDKCEQWRGQSVTEVCTVAVSQQTTSVNMLKHA